MTIQTTIAVYSFKLNFTLSAQGYLLPTAKILLPLRLEHSQYRRWPLSTTYNSVFLCTVCRHQHQSHSQTSLHRGSGNETRPIPVSFPDPLHRGSGNETRPIPVSFPDLPPYRKGGLGMRLDQHKQVYHNARHTKHMLIAFSYKE